MATHILLHPQPANVSFPRQAKAEIVPGQPYLLRQSRGYVRAGDGVRVLTRAGLDGARGVTAALLLELLTVASVCGAWAAWHWLR